LGRTYADIYTNYSDNYCSFNNYNIYTVDEPFQLKELKPPAVLTCDSTNCLLQSNIKGAEFSNGGYPTYFKDQYYYFQGPTFYFKGTNIIDSTSIPIPNYKIEVTGYPNNCSYGSGYPGYPAFLINNLSNYPAEYTTNFNSQTNKIFPQQTHVWYLRDTFIFGGVINFDRYNVPYLITEWVIGYDKCKEPSKINQYSDLGYWTPYFAQDASIDFTKPWLYHDGSGSSFENTI